jgi:hypothetical protein
MGLLGSGLVLAVYSFAEIVYANNRNRPSSAHNHHHERNLLVSKLDVGLAKFYYLKSFKLHNLAYLHAKLDVVLSSIAFLTREYRL